MTDEIVLRLGAGASSFLVAVLCFSLFWRRREKWRQQRVERKRIREFRERWQPTAFDTSRIAPQIRQVRNDPIAAVRLLARHANYRHQLIASARATILQLSYFRMAKEGALGKTEGSVPNRTA
jgi:hypothetical protein